MVSCMQGFDPERDLVRIGAGQPNHHAARRDAQHREDAGEDDDAEVWPAELKDHYMVMDTICDATQVQPCPIQA